MTLITLLNLPKSNGVFIINIGGCCTGGGGGGAVEEIYIVHETRSVTTYVKFTSLTYQVITPVIQNKVLRDKFLGI